MKKLNFALIAVVMLIMSICCFTVSAANVSVTLEGGYVGVDDYVRVPVYLDSLGNKIDCVVVENFSYDRTAFEFAGYEKATGSIISELTENEFDGTDKIIDVAFDDLSAKAGYICNLMFKVREDAAFDSYDFGVTGYAMNNTSMLAANVTEATVTIENLDRGDVNVDGNVDIDDAILLFQHSMMPEEYPLSYSGLIDFEKSGFIDIDDAILLFQHSMMPDEYELNSEWVVGILGEDEEPEEEVVEPVVKTEPFFLIDDFLMGDTTGAGGVYRAGSGWLYDYTGGSRSSFGGSSAYTNTLDDTKYDDGLRLYKRVYPQDEGELVFETSFGFLRNFDGMLLNFYDEDGNVMFTMGTTNKVGGITKQGLFFTDGDERVEVAATKSSLIADSSNHGLSSSTYRLSIQIRPRIVFDLDNRTATVQISGIDFGTFKLKDGTGAFATVEFATAVDKNVSYIVKQVHLYKNYDVFDVFRNNKVGTVPYGYKVKGDTTVQYVQGINENQGDFYSVRMNVDASAAYAKRSFDAVGGKARYEVQLRTENGADGVYFLIGTKNDAVIKVVTSDNKFYIENADGTLGKELRQFITNVWQEIAIDADVELQTATIKINGKVVAEDVPFAVETAYINRLEFGSAADETDVVWFDDVKVYRLFEYDDYVPEPVPLDTGDYILSMSVCNLWRNGSHYGWMHVASHPEIEPITGFYDEGSAEAMDWEIKFLAEHGVKNYNMCWYSPNGDSSIPIKKPRMSDALHDGYFNAKYSDYLSFSIMWENSNSWSSNPQNFKDTIFPYWMEWYFSDDRYFRVYDENTGEEKLLLTIYKYERVLQMVCGSENPTGSKKEQAEEDVQALIQWMSDRVKEAGYADGLIVIFNHSGWGTETDRTINNMGATAIYPYAWGDTAWNVNAQKQIIEGFYDQSQAAGLDLLALAAVGFNDIGWAYERHRLISDEGFEELLTWFRDDYMPRFEDADESWKKNFIQFDTWNEYGEGHYIYPTRGMEAIEGEYGYDGYSSYGYLEAMAKVFGNDYDEVLHADELDIFPTQEQKSRVGHLYYNDTQTIRREFLPQNTVDAIMPEISIASYSFRSQGDVVNSLQNAYGAIYDHDEGGYYIKSVNNDPIINLNSDIVAGKSADDVDIIYIRMKSKLGATNGQIFYKTSKMTSDYNETDSIIFPFDEPGVWVEYYIDAKNFPDSFGGTIEKMRFDVGSLADNEVWVSDLRLLKYSEAQLNHNLAISIDGTEYIPKDRAEVRSFDKGEIYLAPADNDHFYMRTHMFYEWRKDEGTLYLDTPSGTTFEFTEGSDIVILNGTREETLAQPFEVFDGVPVLPLIYILNRAEYTYLYNTNTYTLDIYVNANPFLDIENGNAENPDKADAFYSGNESTVSIVTDPTNEGNCVWRVVGADNTNSTIKTELDLLDGYDYTVEFDIYIDSLNGEDWWNESEYDLNFVAEYAEYGTDETIHPLDAVKVEFGSWQHVTYTFETSRDLDDDAITETLGFYILPDAWDGYGINFYLDNFMVTAR